MNGADIRRLRQIIDTEIQSEVGRILYRDAFSLGCYLSLTGETHAGRKICHTVLSSLGFEKRGELFNEILDSLVGNERSYVDVVGPHLEVKELFAKSIRNSTSKGIGRE